MLNSRYELIEYVNDVNREYVEVLVEQNINGRTDTTYTYGVDRISMELFNQTSRTSYYLYDPRGSVAGLADTKGHLTKTYQYTVTGELAYGSATYENEYTYNGESYNPNIHSQYLRARYYSVVTASFLTEDSYLGNIREPLTLNRYNYCVSSYLNYVDPSGNRLIPQDARDEIQKLVGRDYYIPRIQGVRDKILDALGLNGFHLEMLPSMREGKTIPPMWTPTYGVERDGNGAWMDGGIGAFLNNIKCEHDAEYYLQIAAERAEENRRNEACGAKNEVNPYEKFTINDYNVLLRFARESLDYDGFIAVSYVILNRAISRNMTIEEIGRTREFSAYDENINIADIPDEVKRAAKDVLEGNVDNPIGDAEYFFGISNKKGKVYDLWVDKRGCTFAKEISGNVYYKEWGKVHNQWTLTDDEKNEDYVIIIYDAKKKEWVNTGDIIIDGEVVIQGAADKN